MLKTKEFKDGFALFVTFMYTLGRFKEIVKKHPFRLAYFILLMPVHLAFYILFMLGKILIALFYLDTLNFDIAKKVVKQVYIANKYWNN